MIFDHSDSGEGNIPTAGLRRTHSGNITRSLSVSSLQLRHGAICKSLAYVFHLSEGTQQGGHTKFCSVLFCSHIVYFVIFQFDKLLFKLLEVVWTFKFSSGCPFMMKNVHEL